MQLVVRRVPRYKPQFVRMKRPADALRRADSVKLTTQKPYLAQPWLLRKDDPEGKIEAAEADNAGDVFSKTSKNLILTTTSPQRCLVRFAPRLSWRGSQCIYLLE